jgi:prolyl 4-hydroxylase
MNTASALTLAARYDAEGRHSEAVDELARGARNGDVAALAELGKRLFTGVNAPFRPSDAIGLLVDAAKGGSGDAAALVSVIAAGGIHAPQNWDAGLDYLELAARHGDPGARQQLRLLAGRPADDDGAADWTALRGQADIGAWLTPPTVVTHRDRPRVQSVEGLVPAAVCDWIVRQAEPRLRPAEVHDPATGLAIMGDTRTNRVANFGLTDTSLINLLVQARIAAATGSPIAVMEAFAVLNYRVGEEASEHFDFLDPDVPAYAAEIAELGQRVATCLLYLNTDYGGGETDFPILDLMHKGRTGDALIFHSARPDGAPDPVTLHAGRPPTYGEKWVLSQFIRNKPWLGRS